MTNLLIVLGMYVEEDSEKGEGLWGGGLLALEDTWLLTQESDQDGMTFVDFCDGFNELSRLVMLSTVRNRCPAGKRFVFNCY